MKKEIEQTRSLSKSFDQNKHLYNLLYKKKSRRKELREEKPKFYLLPKLDLFKEFKNKISKGRFVVHPHRWLVSHCNWLLSLSYEDSLRV